VSQTKLHLCNPWVVVLGNGRFVAGVGLLFFAGKQSPVTDQPVAGIQHSPIEALPQRVYEESIAVDPPE
jgi:hypothetical protein